MAYSGKNVLIIGGTHGIGLATAQLLIQDGATVILTGRNTTPAQELLGSTAHTLQLDLQNLSEITSLPSKIQSHLGSPDAKIDLLFLNAGYASLDPLATLTEASFDRTFNTNVKGTFFAAQALAPLVRDGGAIVFTTSIANRVGIPGMGAYAASKAAVHSLVQTFAAELAGRGVRVNAVSPGYVKTPTMGVEGTSKEVLEAFEEHGRETTPLGRVGEAGEVARTVRFLGFEGTFVTGVEVVVDGGLAFLKK
jgi:NAD(P)-dependent dehydrogenase (short-subunit alcohol dehydrogenase family)